MTPEQRQALIEAARAKRAEMDVHSDALQRLRALVEAGLPTTLTKIREWFEALKAIAEEVTNR